MKQFGLILSLVWILSMTGCATPPDVDYDTLRAQDSTDQATHLQLLRDKDQEAAGEPFLEGNRVQLLQDGNATYPAMLAAIKRTIPHVPKGLLTDRRSTDPVVAATIKKGDITAIGWAVYRWDKDGNYDEITDLSKS